MVGHSVAHLDDIEEFKDAGCHYRPIRHHLGITAFGVTAWTAGAGGDRVINEHDPDDPSADQELFLVLRGHAEFELDGDRVDAPAGTFVFAPPRTKRTASAKQDGSTILALEGTPGKRTRPVEMSEEFRTTARTDSDLDPIRDEPAFERLTNE